MIEIQNITVKFLEKIILNNITLTIDEGLHLVLGKNGSGKTTLLKTIAALIKPVKGFVKIYGKNIHTLPRKDIAKLIGYVWQNPYAGFVETTVEDEIVFSSRLTKTNLNRELVEMLVPKHLIDRDPFTLSGGEAKRVAIASVLSLDQPIWLLDEPFDYLDSNGVEAVVKIIKYGLMRNKIVIISSTRVEFVNLLKPKTIIVLDNGGIAYRGNLDSISGKILESFGVLSKEMICG